MIVVAAYLFACRWRIDITSFSAIILGSSLVIASGCVFNNYLDRGIDAKMKRTSKRALVTQAISVKAALIYGTILSLTGFAALIIGTNWLTFWVGLTGLICYVLVYGIAKRVTVHGTLIGSISGSIPPVAGYTAYSGRIDAAAVILFLIMTFWQMPHFYAIAMYRFKDYKAAGLPVLPVKRGMKTTKIQIMLYTLGFGVAAIALSLQSYTGYIYLITLSVIGIIWLYKGFKGFHAANDEAWARQMFGFSLIVLVVLAVALPLGTVLP